MDSLDFHIETKSKEKNVDTLLTKMEVEKCSICDSLPGRRLRGGRLSSMPIHNLCGISHEVSERLNSVVNLTYILLK